MRSKNLLLAALVACGAVLPASTMAQQTAPSYSYAFIRYIEGDLQIQRATELEPSEATVNHPIMTGDRVWTRAQSRAEIQFGDGSILRMDERTRVDFADFGENGGETLIRQWSGSLIIRLNEERASSFRVDTPAGTIYPASAALIRIDVYDGGASTVLSVYEGVAELASEEGSVLVRSGQRSIIEPGRRPEPSFAFNTTQWDAFASWSDERDREYAYTEHIEGLPQEVEAYGGYLQHHGTWRVDVSLGPVWYPSVSVGWYPYSQGYWSYTPYGYTWVSYEPWGWAPYHYGRWGYNHWGWYWIPGVHWGPAWVSWAFGPSWVGWCPLGYYDRPVHYHRGFPYRGGKAVPRGSVAARTRGDGWNFARADNFGRRAAGKARLRSEDIRATAHQAKLLESGAILDRNLRPTVVGAAAMTRLPRGGLAELRARNDSGGATVTGRGLSTRDGNPAGNPVVDRSGAIRGGQARSRSLPSLSNSGEARSGKSNLGKASPLSSTGRSRPGSTISNRSSDDSSLRSSRPLGTRGSAIQRGTVPRQGSDTPATLTQGRSRTTRQPSGQVLNPSTTDRSSSGRSTGRIIRSRPESSPSQPSTRGSSSIRNRNPTKESSSSPSRFNPSSTARRVEGSIRSRVPESTGRAGIGASRSRPSPTPRSSPRVGNSENRTGSSIGRRTIYDRITRSRPSTLRPSSPSRNRPSLRSPSSGRGSVKPPSRSSSPPRSSASSGRARSTRSKPKKKN
jgi:hypothetical protein